MSARNRAGCERSGKRDFAAHALCSRTVGGSAVSDCRINAAVSKKDFVRETRIREEKLVLTRPFDRHLDSDELDALVSSQAIGVPSSGQLSEGAVREAQRHVDSCKDCQRKVQMHKSVQSEILRRLVPAVLRRVKTASRILSGLE